MIKRLQHRYIQRILSVIGKSVCKTGIVTALCLLFPVCSFALPAEHYASSSALSEGKWVRVEISGEGLKFISNSALRQMGFSNPSEVNVYGYGGGMLSENLNASQPDDLPVQTLTRTADGIIFYAADNIVWTTPITFGFPYSHTKNLYAETSYYFLSDRPLNSELPAVVDMKARSGVEEINKFKAPLLHEQDIALASNTGAIYLGEDFRSTVTRKFTFQLTGNVGKEVSARVNFGALNTATTYLAFKANGVNLPKGENDRVSGGSASSEVFIRRGTPVKTFDCNSEKLDFEINYSYSGVISTARLDYIEVVYDRAMTLAGDQMIITHIVDDPVTFVVSGVDNATEIWDVTDPAKVKKISYSISGTTCKFTVDDKGLRRFAVFNPSKVTTGIKESKNISNQDIHALETPDYLIITPSEYRQAAEQLAECHRRRGLTVTVLDPESIYNEFASGNPDVTAFRKLLKMWYDRAGEDGRAPKYCMIFSRPTFDNKKVSTEVANCGYPRLPIWNNPSIETGAYSFSTDDYIGMLEDSDTFDIQGPNPISVAVGRFAVTSVKEAEEMVNKTIKYIERP